MTKQKNKIMIILKRQEVINALAIKMQELSDDELIELYQDGYGVDIVIAEVVDEEYIESSIWDEMHVTVSATITDEGIEIIPDSYEELADYWEVEVESDEFWDRHEELEKKWSAEVGRTVKQQ